MIRMLMHGCNGAMGQVIAQIAEQDKDIEITAGVDINTQKRNNFPVFASLEEVKEEVDVIIDFASAKATDTLLAYGVERQIPMVLCKSTIIKRWMPPAARRLPWRTRLTRRWRIPIIIRTTEAREEKSGI